MVANDIGNLMRGLGKLNDKYCRFGWRDRVHVNVNANLFRRYDVKHTNGTIHANKLFGENNGFLYLAESRHGGSRFIIFTLDDLGRNFKGRIPISLKYNKKSEQLVNVKVKEDIYKVASLSLVK